MGKKDFMAQMTEIKNKRPANGLSAEQHIKETLIVIDDLKHLIPPLVSEEFSQLEENLVKNGIRVLSQFGKQQSRSFKTD